MSIVAVILCLVLAAFTGATGTDGPVSRLLGRALVPAQRVVTHAAVSVANTYNKYFRYDELVAENEELQQQVIDLTEQLADAEAAVEENESLREMLDVTERNTEYTYAAAEVVGRTMDEWSSVLTIDAGSEDGLELNDCVVTAEGMVGYITSLADHSAEVTTIIDSNMSAGASIVRSGEIGVAEGDYQLMTENKLRVSYLTDSSDVEEGDTVKTSGTGGVFPEGLTIGTVESIRTESDGMSNYAVVEPAVDVSAVTRVYIIIDSETTRE